MSAGHSPGTWVCGLPADGGRINVYADDTMAFRICRVDSDADFGNRASANARLIAAAPELLEAARQAESLIPHLCDLDGSPASERVVCMLRAAIAKAGEQA